MLDPHAVLVGAGLGVIGSIRYAIATVGGTARPNLVTWTLWAAAPLIAFFAQVSAGVGLPAVLTLAAGVGPSIVVVSAVLTRHARSVIGPFDVACAGAAGVALVVWLALDAAPAAVVLAVGADALAALPTIRKAFREPASENATFYVLVGTGATITLLTVRDRDPVNWVFAAYMLVLCLLLVSLIVRGRRATPARPTP